MTTYTPQASNELRANILTAIAPAIEAKGFTTELQTHSSPRLRISHPSIGLVATLATNQLRFGFGHDSATAVLGSVRYDGRLFSQRDSEFALLAGKSLPSVVNIIARLRRDLPLIIKQSAAQAATRAREASDNVILETLPVVDGAQVSVFDGKVDIKLNDITPAQAAAVLAALADRQAELVDDRDNQVERDLADEANDR